MSNIQFRLAARTDAAGKYNESAPLEGNEDNMFVDADLCNQVQGQFMADKVVDLSEKGCLMVVADGMGGMNAGEVASDIAIRTVMGYFSPERMSQKTFSNAQARASYLEEVVVAADAAIKADAQNNKEHEGMGSTLIMAWLCDGQVCITWCGDSRAYLFRPAVGFKQVSKDHSYVQGLVDEGKITEAEAFDHPYGNIITRSLGDPEKKAKPDSICFNVYQGDIIMLCSDGLSGVLRDHKTIINGERVDTENLEDLIRNNRATMAGCRDELFAAAERNDWYDNVTAILCEIVKGDPLPVSQAKPAPQAAVEQPVTYAPMPDPSATIGKKRSKVLIPVIAIAAVLLLGVAGLLVWLFVIPKGPSEEEKFFAKCQKMKKIELYRSYLELYPEGHFIKDANAWIEHYEDSIAQLPIQNPTDSQNIADNTTASEDKKAEKEKTKAEKEKEKKQKEAEKKEDKKDKKKDQKSEKEEKIEEEETVEDNQEVKSGKGEVKERGFNNSTDFEDLSNRYPANEEKIKNPADKLKQAPGSNNQKGKSSLTDEQARAAEDANTIDKCCAFVDKYTEKSTHYPKVYNTFKALYQKRLNDCKTVDDCERFLEQHDYYKKKMKMSREDDNRWYRDAKNKKKEKEKEQKEREKATEKIGDGILKAGASRPEPGVNNAPNGSSSDKGFKNNKQP